MTCPGNNTCCNRPLFDRTLFPCKKKSMTYDKYLALATQLPRPPDLRFVQASCVIGPQAVRRVQQLEQFLESLANNAGIDETFTRMIHEALEAKP